MRLTIINWLRRISYILIMTHDLVMVAIAWLLANWLRVNLTVKYSFYIQYALHTLPIILIIQAILFFVFRFYRGVWRFTSLPDLMRVFKVVILGILISAMVLFYIDRLQVLPRTIFILYGMILFFLLAGPRILYRLIKNKEHVTKDFMRVLVIGAGNAGEGFVRDALRDRRGYRIMGFVDDDNAKLGREIQGIRVIGRSKNIPALVKDLEIGLIVIAIPSAHAETMRSIIEICETTGVSLRTLPSLVDITSGKVNITELREVSIEDLLGREPINLDWKEIESEISGKVILITGGGGSIGSELCKQIAVFHPDLLIILENSEFNLYEIEMELKKNYPHLHFKTGLTSVVDRAAVREILRKYTPDIIFHAAAYKHVPILEDHVRAAVMNNFLGTVILSEEAIAVQVSKFVLISTDKAVNPTNVMGMTKRAAEIFCQSVSKESNTKFITIRFGNVLGSCGSVVPLFKKQLLAGGPLTVTHPEITRYFMTIPEAVQLILQATAIGGGGNIFVLDMGEPIKIAYLAQQLIRLAGKTVGEDVKIVYTGLRPGEKLYEELFYENEKLIETKCEKINKAQSIEVDVDKVKRLIKDIIITCEQHEEAKLMMLLNELIHE